MDINLAQAKKLLALESDPKLAIFDELEQVNESLKGVIDAVKASKTTEINVANSEDLRLDLSPLERNFDALKASVESVTEAVKAEKELDLSTVEKLLSQIVKKEDSPVDTRHLQEICDTLDSVLYAVQTMASKSNESISVTLKIV
jgi:hypothetical protein